jgi:hypothetical protein
MLTRTRRRALFALVPLAAVPLLVAATHGSKQLTALSCGQTITTSTTLSADLGPCAGIGVTIGADHVTLNLNGHRIFGTGAEGVDSSQVGVVVENGSVANFVNDVFLTGDSNRVTNLRVSNSGGGGIQASGKNDVITANRAFANGGTGILGSGPGSQYTNNVLQSNGADGLVADNAASISGNKALNNSNAGIRVVDTANVALTVTNNVANGNQLDGIHHAAGNDATVVTLSGNRAYFNGQFGVNAAPGVTDGGNNRADSNGTAAQCRNVVCS